MELQYQLSNGSWIDCKEKIEEFLNLCVENDYRKLNKEEIIELLKSGKTVRNDKSDWYSNCRIKPIDKIYTHIPNNKQTCSICGRETNRFTTIANGDICDDCL